MKHTVHHIHRSLWVVLALILLLIALVFTFARLATPYLANQQPLIERAIGSFISQPIKIGSLQVAWHRFTPVIKTTDVIIFDDAKTHPLLKVNEMDLGIDLFHSLLDGTLELGKLTISGAQLTVQQTLENTFVVKGIGTFGGTANGDSLDNFTEWLFAAPRLSLRNINLNWYDKKNNLIPITGLDFDLRNRDTLHTLWGQANLAQKQPGKFEFIIAINADSSQKTIQNARFYFQGKNILLSQLKNYPIKNYTLQDGLANFKVWGLWQNQQLQKLQSLFTLNQTKILKADNPEPFFLAHVDANLLWKANDSWTLDASLKNLSYTRWQKIPGFTHLNTFIHLAPQEGFAKLFGKSTRVDFGNLFRAPLTLNLLNSEVKWQKQPEGLAIEADDAHIRTEDADAIGSMSLLIPTDDSSPVINLLANMQMLGRKHLADDLPIGILSAGLVEWLNDSIVDIEKIDSTLILRGPIHNFPFDDNDGVFIVDSQVHNLDLNYWPGWPKATKISGNLVFKNRSMEMTIDDGFINSVPLKNIQVTIPVIEKNILAMLNISGSISTDLANVLQFVHESPLRENGLSVTDYMQGKGPVQMQLQIAIPLEHTTVEATVAGQMALQNAELALKQLNLTNLNGQLTFTRHTVNAEKLTATLWDNPLELKIDSPKNSIRIGFKYKDFTGDLSSVKEGWVANLQSPDLDGSITIPTDQRQAIDANFQRLYIQSDESDNLAKISPADIPKLDLTAKDVRYGNKKLGQVELQVTPMNTGLQINNLRISFPTYSIAANGYWQLKNDKHLTQMVGNLISNNLSDTLTSWSLPSTISAKQAKLHFNLTWNGPIYNPSWETMGGKMDLTIQQGQVTNLGPQTAMKMDIGRLLSLLSFESITRRLKLDFSDVTGKGFPFDSITGNFQLVDGNVYTRNLVVAGPIADVGIAGRIGLAAEDYDLMFNVTPKISGSLTTLVGLAASPVAPVAALAFGPAAPAVGAAAWIASRFVGGTINKIATDTYHMTGAWGSPQIKQVGNFFTKSPKKK